MCISDMQKSPRGTKPQSIIAAGTQEAAGDKTSSSSALRQRSQSLNDIEGCHSRDFLARMKRTHEFKVKGFKGNIRGEHIHGSFTTLEEMLQKLPQTVAFDIELSKLYTPSINTHTITPIQQRSQADNITEYPMLWEAQDWKMDLYGIELNLYLDTILDLIYKYGGNRSIVLTSFSPELCILATHKQAKYPVMFLNESSLFPTGDVRASNLQEAIQFARRWDLPGVVMSSEPFVASPGLVQFVRDAGLVCWSFGVLNNCPGHAGVCGSPYLSRRHVFLG